MEFLPDVIMLGQFPLAVGALTGLLGGWAAYLCAGWSARRAGGDSEAAQDLILNLLIGGILAAKLLYVLLDLRGVIANPATLLLFPYGPLAVPAGLAGGIGLAAWNLRKRADWAAILDLAAAPAALGLTLAALGWKGPGSWAYAPALAVAAALAWLRLLRRPAAMGGVGSQTAWTVVLSALALATADLAHPAAGLVAGVTGLQLGAAIAASLAWVWSRRSPG